MQLQIGTTITPNYLCKNIEGFKQALLKQYATNSGGTFV